MGDWKWKQQKKRGGKKGGGWLPDWKWRQQKKGGGKGWKKQYKKTDPSKTVWIGDIPDGSTFKELKALGDQCGGCKWAEKWKDTGAIGFASAEEAAAAVASLNGALIGGKAIVADAWEKKSKGDDLGKCRVLQ